jgi:hypothetical protein
MKSIYYPTHALFRLKSSIFILQKQNKNVMNDSVELVIKSSTGEIKKYPIHFPNVGDYYRIECLKQELSRSNYGGLVTSKTQNAYDALDMIDIEATLTVLAPKLIEDMKVTRFSQLGIKDYLIIRKAYLESVHPFIVEVRNLLKPE